MKLLVRYGKLGRAQYSSHRDFARGFERGLNRAQIPMAYSSGFSPHPRLSYINPAPTGTQSQAEYLVIGLREACDPEDVRSRLDAAMPEGFPILEVGDPVGRSFDASLWEVRLAADLAAVEQAIGNFLAASEVMVARETKNGLRRFDARGAVLVLRSLVSPAGPVDCHRSDIGNAYGISCDHLVDTADPSGTAEPEWRESEVAIAMVIRHSEPLVRPDDVVGALRECGTIGRVGITRLRQGTVDELVGLARAGELA